VSNRNCRLPKIAAGSFALAALMAAGPAHAADSVSLITDFGYNGRHAYFFVALDKGYYKAAGLDVKILRGQGSVDAIR
jgi:NitT/TauT family transport system substrate-binding protein